MSWWVVVAAAIVVAAVGWAATSWLLGEANQAGDVDKRASVRVEAIKTGLGIGAGTTGSFALLLAVRRQQHNESDATEKNVTELYTKAADQLGSEEAPVRLAGAVRARAAGPQQPWPTPEHRERHLRLPADALHSAGRAAAAR
ncbi:hypothetical protein [Amycolatopsis sp. NPDC003731]